MIVILSMMPFQGLGFVALPLHRAMPYVNVLCPFRVAIQSPEGASSANDGCSPSKKLKAKTSPERALYTSEAAMPLATNDGYSPSNKNKNKKSPAMA